MSAVPHWHACASRRSRPASGFSLVELMAVLAILAILSAIAYPNYAAHMRKARRVEGQVALLEALQKQERYYTQHHTYLAFSAGTGGVDERRFKWYSGSSAAASAYELRGQACPEHLISRCVELQALPGTALVDPSFKDTDCEVLSINSLGEQKASGAGKRCWL